MPTSKPIYLDYNATTPLDPRVLEVMLPFFTEHFGNPSSSQHQWGWTSSRAVEKARSQVAGLLSAKPSEIFFNSGATEGNNWVLQSLFNQWREAGSAGKFHVLSSAVEHSSVLKTLEQLKKIGADVEYVPVNSYGQVQVPDVAQRLRADTKLLSFMWVNNEVGSVNPIPELGVLAHKNKIYFHSDATQAIGKIKVDLEVSQIDFVTLSAHKIYGPKGSGALYIRSKNPRIELQPFMWGGSQEKGSRAGTVNVPGVIGLGEACDLCIEEMKNLKTSTDLRNQFLETLLREIPGTRLNGHPTDRALNNLNLTFKGRRLEDALPFLMRLGFSTGSACHSGTMNRSYVLKAMGLSDEEMSSTLRLSLGRFTTAEQLGEAADLLKKAFVISQSSLNI